MNRKIVSFFIFFFLVWGNAFSSFELNERAQQAYIQIIRLKLDEGKRLLDEEQRMNPGNALPLLYYNYLDFLKAFISEEKKDFETFGSNTEKRLDRLNDENDSPFLLCSRAEMLLQDAMLRIKFREFVSAAWEIRQAYQLIQKNEKLYPSFLLNKKTAGFLHALVGAIPKNYHWLVQLAGMKGTIPQGISELNDLLKEIEGTPYKIYKEEILFYLASLQTAFSMNEKTSSSLIERMKPFSSQSLLMRYFVSNLQMKDGGNDDALQTLLDSMSLPGTFSFYFLNYKTGMAKLRKLDFTAEKDFQNFTLHFHGINYIRSAYQKLAWIYLLQGDQEKYSEFIGKCKISGSDFTDEDKDATAEATRNEIPNVILLRARLLFDGGYYLRALSEIKGKTLENFPRFKDQLEVTYRFARILDKMDQDDRAVEYFEQTIKNGSSSRFYFAANAALLLGNIFEAKHDFDKAKKYYTQCLSMRHHEYQNSIDQKAQAGLERLK